MFISFIYIISGSSMYVLFSLTCNNFALDLIQCYCAKCVCVSVYECLQKYVCIYITYLSETTSLSITDENFIDQNLRAKSIPTSNMCQSSSCPSNYVVYNSYLSLLDLERSNDFYIVALD